MVHAPLNTGTYLELSWIGTNELSGFTAILEDNEGRHLVWKRIRQSGDPRKMKTYRLDADFLGNIRLIVNVDFVKFDLRISFILC